MAYSLEDFCVDARGILLKSDNSSGREMIRQKLEWLLCDPAFCAAYLGPDSAAGMQQVFQDPKLHFCVLTYNMTKQRTSPPHDHGNSWAIYGQISHYTDMTIWSAVSDELENTQIKPVSTFRLQPGQAGLFDVHEIHSIDYPSDAKFVRVTGVDMAAESRRVFDVDTGTVRKIEQVGTDSSR